MINNLYHVSFPKLGINLEIDPIAFTIGSIQIHWYGIIIATGFLLALTYIYNRANDFNLDRNKLIDILLIGTICGIIGARVYYVVFYPGYFYKFNPMKLFNIPEGGIAIYGAISGGIIGGGIAAYLKKIKLAPILDVTSLGLLIGQSIGRWGNFFNQEAFGNITNLPWGMSSENTFNKTVHPCFLYESIWCLLGFTILHIYSKKSQKTSGLLFNLYILWYSFGRFFIEGLRVDSLIFVGFRVSQLLSLILFFVSLIIIFINKYKIFKNNLC